MIFHVYQVLSGFMDTPPTTGLAPPTTLSFRSTVDRYHHRARQCPRSIWSRKSWTVLTWGTISNKCNILLPKYRNHDEKYNYRGSFWSIHTIYIHKSKYSQYSEIILMAIWLAEAPFGPIMAVFLWTPKVADPKKSSSKPGFSEWWWRWL